MNNYKCPQCGLVNWIKTESCKRCQLPNQYAEIASSQQKIMQNQSVSQTASVVFQTIPNEAATKSTSYAPSSIGVNSSLRTSSGANNYQYTQSIQNGINTICGMCSNHSNSMKKLYDDDVCKSCHRQYISRRQAAFLLDLIIYRGIATVILIWMVMLTSESLALYAMILSCFPILIKDGTKGVSIGKLVAGLRTVDFSTKQPCGFGKSILRNIILYIPLMLLIELVFIQDGKRLGDRIVNTRVVWNKYEKARVFWK
jgi:uncharacterized RDD family membrane protein YckC